MLKKTLFLLAAAALLLSLAGCGAVTGLLFQNSTESGGGKFTEFQSEAAGAVSQPDLVSTQETTAYYVPHDGAAYGTYHYVFTDYIRNGAAESMQILQTLSLSQHTIVLRQLAVRHQTYDPETEQETVTYSADSGEEISEEAYLAAADDFFEGMEKQ